jgi:regulator of nonsense transcripts 3
MPEEVKAKDKSHKKSKTSLNKVVIRKLPPNINEEEFLEQIAPTEFSDFYFVPADYSLLADASSRAYIEFKSQEDVSFIV